MWWSVLSLALREIRRNLLRSSLTMLGIIIGVAAVIIMVTIGNGTTAKISAQIESLGSNMLILRPGQRFVRGSREAAKPLDLADSAALRQELPAVVAAAGISNKAVTVVYGSNNWTTGVTGMENDYLIVRNWQLARGRFISASEQRAGAAVCLLGATLQRELFGNLDPVGETVRLGRVACEVVGLLASKGQSAMGSDQDDVLLMPLRAHWRLISGQQKVSLIYLSARDDTSKAKTDVERLMRERRHIGPGDDDDFSVIDMKEIANTMTGTTEVMTSLLGAVAAVSLIVGGIGIMNIMLVSVTERTREIGIRLAIGALEKEVQRQFLVEAVVLSSVGGIIGIMLAVVVTYFIANAIQVPLVFDGAIILLAFVFSVAVGVVFGYIPARKAARLDPIEALRHE
ncbi:MAG TPA: FtsX-like permease family protein [Candidatus Tenderia electrophaga]|uniref:FtsX-like permease family protein n=1 Tax=Candidatus Tenderia electrophaga TaxID=1748243 RepID=A0A832J2R9_9GAMM|nr:FtsX-like permease family protein [Candidatus Tenderia electrophaga]